MFDLNDINEKPIVDRYGPLFRRLRRITFLVAGGLLALSVVIAVLLARGVSALQQETAELQRSISHLKSIYPIDNLEQEWARYAVDIHRAARAVAERSAWGERLGIVSRVIPEGLSLDYISVVALSSDASRRLMTLETFVVTKEKQGLGLARSFVDRLKNEEEYGEEIKINFDEKVRINGKEMEEIQIMAKLSR